MVVCRVCKQIISLLRECPLRPHEPPTCPLRPTPVALPIPSSQKDLVEQMRKTLDNSDFGHEELVAMNSSYR